MVSIFLLFLLDYINDIFNFISKLFKITTYTLMTSEFNTNFYNSFSLNFYIFLPFSNLILVIASSCTILEVPEYGIHI